MKSHVENWRKHLLLEDSFKQIEQELIYFLESENLDEGIMDRLLPYVLAGGAALGSMAGKAEAKPISQDVAAKRIAKVLNQKKIKDRYNLDHRFFDFDSGVQDVAKQISMLSKIRPDKNENDMIKIVTNGIEKNYKNGIPRDITFDTAASAVKQTISKIAKKSRVDNFQDFKTGNPRYVVINSLNGVLGDILQNKKIDKSFDQFASDLENAKKSGAISDSEYRNIIKIMKGDDKVTAKAKKVIDILEK